MNIPQGCPAETNRCRYIGQMALHQYHIGRVNRNISPCSNGNPHICTGKCGCIIDSITDHGGHALLLQFADHTFFSIRKDTCNHFIHTCFSSDRICSTLIIPSQHNDTDSKLS